MLGTVLTVILTFSRLSYSLLLTLGPSLLENSHYYLFFDNFLNVIILFSGG